MRTASSLLGPFLIIFSLSSCSAPSISETRYLSLNAAPDFFAPVADKASAYFVCGQHIQKNVMFGDIDSSDSFTCSFSINGKTYEYLDTSVISKIVLEPGRYVISQPDQLLAKNQPMAVTLKPGTTTTFIADYTFFVRVLGHEHVLSIRSIEGSVPDPYVNRKPVSM